MKRLSYYVSKKNIFLWLALAALIVSSCGRIAYFCGKGADAKTVWLLIVLPVFAAVLYALILLLGGKERFYRTAVPVFLFAIYFGIETSMSETWRRYVLVCWIAYFAFAILYTFILSGKSKHVWFMTLCHAAALAAYLYGQKGNLVSQPWFVLPDALILLAGFFTMLSVKLHLDGAYHPTWGDRPDGRRLRTLDPLSVVANYIMPNRNGASNSIRETLEITKIEQYIREKRKQGYAGFGVTHVLIAAYARLVAQYPAVNRFLSGQRVYSRDEDIQFCMMVKEEMSTDAVETAMKLHLTPYDTPITVYEKMTAEVARIKDHTDSSNFDAAAKLLSLIPGVALKFSIWFVKLLDYFGLLPKFLTELSPFHGSVFFTSMGSLGIPPIVHHLYDLGNLPVFLAFGCKYRRNEVEADGSIVPRRYMDYIVNVDERICDGFYFASALKDLKRLLAHPERLDEPPQTVNRDIE